MPRPRILFVNHTSTISGAEFVLLNLVEAWSGATAFLFETGALNEALEQRGLTIIRARSSTGLSAVRRDGSLLKILPLTMQLVAITREIARVAKNFDVVYANSQKAFVLAAIATAIARRPLIWHLHDIISPAHFGRAQRLLQIGLANRRAAQVIVPSTVAADAFAAAGGDRGRVTIVPNGRDIEQDARSPAELRAHLGLPTGPLIGVFSRLAPWKGQHVVLRALAKLPELRCIIAGSPLFGEDVYAEHLRQLARDLGVSERVAFLGQRNDIPLLMQAVDIVVHPSIDPEPFGLTLVEAMRAGTPVIATSAGASSEILEGGEAGRLVPPDDAGALAAAITASLADPPGAKAKTCAYAAARARKLYGVAAMQAHIATIVERVAKGAPP